MENTGHCLGCKKRFKKKGHQLFCSTKCPSEFILKRCSVCKVDFFQPRKASGKIMFCSQICRIASEKNNKYLDIARSPRNKTRSVSARKRKILSGDKIDPHVIFSIFNWTCIICDEEIKQGLPSSHPRSASLEHVVPLSGGGTHSWHNVAPAHVECNVAKGNEIIHHLVDKVINFWSNL